MKFFNKDSIKKIIGFILFFVIFIYSFIIVSYFFRLNGIGYTNRYNVVGIKSEGPLDMVYIGSSEVFVYYNALQAYEEFGYTSYAMSTEGLNCDAIKYYVKEVLKNQRPSLFVIGVSPFLNYSTGIDEGTMRKSTDSLDYDFDRFRLIEEYYKRHDMTGVDKLSLYIDLIKYHTNYDAFSNSDAYTLMFNNSSNFLKGYLSMATWQYQTRVDGFVNENRIPIHEEAEDILRDLLDYLKSENLNVLFTISPYCMDGGTYAACNYILDIVNEYGYNGINTNAYYDEMGLDFEKDFYNSTHVNSLGAEKYTRFIGNYISTNYNLPNHHGEPAYYAWDFNSAQYKTMEADKRNFVLNMIKESGTVDFGDESEADESVDENDSSQDNSEENVLSDSDENSDENNIE